MYNGCSERQNHIRVCSKPKNTFRGAKKHRGHIRDFMVLIVDIDLNRGQGVSFSRVELAACGAFRLPA